MISLTSRITSYLISVNLNNPIIHPEELTAWLMENGFQKKLYKTGFLVSHDIKTNNMYHSLESSKQIDTEPYNMVGKYSLVPFLGYDKKEMDICYNFGQNEDNSNIIDGILKDLNIFQNLFLHKFKSKTNDIRHFKLEVLLSAKTNKDLLRDFITDDKKIKDLFDECKIYKKSDTVYVYPPDIDVDNPTDEQPTIKNIENGKVRKEVISESDWDELMLKPTKKECLIKLVYRCNTFVDVVKIFKNIETESNEIIHQIESKT